MHRDLEEFGAPKQSLSGMLCRQPLRTIQPQVERDMCHARTALISRWHGGTSSTYTKVRGDSTSCKPYDSRFTSSLGILFGVLTGHIVGPKALICIGA